MTTDATAADTARTDPTFSEAAAAFARIGVLSFGGPAGQIALMHRVLVDEKRWVDEKSFLGALNFCMLLPGPEAMQTATWVGWKLHGVRGGLMAGLLFVLPGAFVMLGLAAGYAAFGRLALVDAIFLGIKAAVLAVVIQALARVAQRALKDGVAWMIAAAAFAAIFLLALPFPVIVIAAALIGFWRGAAPPSAASPPVQVSLAQTIGTVMIWLAVWLVPLGALVAVFGSGHVLSELAWFFSKLAVVTFGGAYAVLAYMAQDVVQHYGWLTAGEMLDGLGLAETTPGPLILVTEFVGFLAAFREGGAPAWGFGIAGAIVALWATFAPCFLWIFAGAPYLDWISAAPRLRSALEAVTACVVGVILNLSVWFGAHVVFQRVGELRLGPLHVIAPDWASLDLAVVALSVVAAGLLFAARWGVLATLGVAAALGAALHAAGLR